MKTFRLHFEIYNTIKFDRKKLIASYLRHVNGVREYFKGREEDLLDLDICSEEGWEKLCPFLEKEIPEAEFPRTNSNKGYGDVVLKVGKSNISTLFFSILRN